MNCVELNHMLSIFSEMQEMMEAADPNGDGKLDFGEFRTLLGM